MPPAKSSLSFLALFLLATACSADDVEASCAEDNGGCSELAQCSETDEGASYSDDVFTVTINVSAVAD